MARRRWIGAALAVAALAIAATPALALVPVDTRTSVIVTP
jgi:hypothetical protein